MRWAVCLAVFAICGGCEVEQPLSLQSVAAFEIPLPSEADRAEFLSMLREVATAEGLHVDSASKEWLQHISRDPLTEMTIHAQVWRGIDDDQPEGTIMDGHGHLGRAWFMFARGENPALATKFRERAMREILRRWPETLSLPIMPTGAIPLHYDLIRTPTGYIVDPKAAPKYQLEGPDRGRS
jgi:hypothetical protein